MGGAHWDGGGDSFIHKGTNGRWRGVLTDKDIRGYTARAQMEIGPDCAAWLTLGAQACVMAACCDKNPARHWRRGVFDFVRSNCDGAAPLERDEHRQEQNHDCRNARRNWRVHQVKINRPCPDDGKAKGRKA